MQIRYAVIHQLSRYGAHDQSQQSILIVVGAHVWLVHDVVERGSVIAEGPRDALLVSQSYCQK